MFLKLLLTALVIAGALLTLRMRSQRNMRQYTSSAPVLNASLNQQRQSRRRVAQFLREGRCF